MYESKLYWYNPNQLDYQFILYFWALLFCGPKLDCKCIFHWEEFKISTQLSFCPFSSFQYPHIPSSYQWLCQGLKGRWLKHWGFLHHDDIDVSLKYYNVFWWFLKCCTFLNLLIFFKESPSIGNKLWVHPVLDLMGVDEIVQVRVLYPLLGPVQPDTDLHREHDGHEASSYQDRANHNDRPDVMILLLVQNIEEEKTEPRQEKKQATGDKE